MQARDRLGQPLGLVGGELRRVGERRQLGPVADLVGQPAAEAGDGVLVAEEAVEPGRVRRAGACAACRGRPGRRRARGRSSGSCVSGSPLTTHTPALRSVPASVSSRARPSANTQRAMPPRGLADCFSSGFSRPPCMRWTTKVAAPKSSSSCLPRRPDEDELVVDRGLGGGHDGLQRGERDRPELRRARCRRTRRRAARRGPGPRAARASVLRARRAPPRTRPRRCRRSPWWVISSSTSPPTRSLPIMNAVWADRSPRPMAAAVS